MYMYIKRIIRDNGRWRERERSDLALLSVPNKRQERRVFLSFEWPLSRARETLMLLLVFESLSLRLVRTNDKR